MKHCAKYDSVAEGAQVCGGGGGARVAAALASLAYVVPVGEHEPEAGVRVKCHAGLAGGGEEAVRCVEHRLSNA